MVAECNQSLITCVLFILPWQQFVGARNESRTSGTEYDALAASHLSCFMLTWLLSNGRQTKVASVACRSLTIIQTWNSFLWLFPPTFAAVIKTHFQGFGFVFLLLLLFLFQDCFRMRFLPGAVHFLRTLCCVTRVERRMNVLMLSWLWFTI